jgi:hypothetical protein
MAAAVAIAIATIPNLVVLVKIPTITITATATIIMNVGIVKRTAAITDDEIIHHGKLPEAFRNMSSRLKMP